MSLLSILKKQSGVEAQAESRNGNGIVDHSETDRARALGLALLEFITLLTDELRQRRQARASEGEETNATKKRGDL